jgi:SulP family sulfate permease
MSREAARRLGALLPGLRVLRRYESTWLRPDMVAGLTVGAMLIPQSMAYAELAGMAPAYGFYAVIGALVVYAAVGTSRHLGVGPEPGTAILAAAGVSSIAGSDPARYIALMSALALVVAAICVAGAVARLGVVASVLSKPVLVGYITGVGLTLLSSQIAAFTGVRITSDSFFPRVAELLRHLDDIHAATLGVGTGTLMLILLLKRRAPRVPGALLGIALASVVVAAFALDGHGVALVGTIPSGLPIPRIPDVSIGDIGRLVPVAAGIAVVGYSDNVLTARSLASRHGYRIDANQELLALGLTNLASGVSQGFPISSSASRTAVPASLGSKTQLVSLVASAFVVASLLGLRPLLGDIPRPALAAVIVTAALAIIDFRGYRTLWSVSREEAALAVTTTLAVIVFGVLTGVVAAVVLSLLVAFTRVARPHDAVLGDDPSVDGWVEMGVHPAAVTEPGLLVYRFDAPLIFVNAERFCERVEAALEHNPGREDWLVLDFEGIGAVDATGLDTLAELVDRLRALDLEVVAVARAHGDVVARLGRAGLLDPPGPIKEFPTINSAVRAYRRRARA